MIKIGGSVTEFVETAGLHLLRFNWSAVEFCSVVKFARRVDYRLMNSCLLCIQNVQLNLMQVHTVYVIKLFSF